MSRRAYFRIVGLLFLATAAALAAVLLPVKEWIAFFLAWIRGFGVAGAFVYALAYVAGTVLLVPGTALTAAAGLLYGPVFGVLLVSPASVAGATLAFLIGRYFARGWVESKLAKYPRFSAIDRAVERRSFKVVLLLRLQPVFLPFALLNYALGVTSVRLRDYVLASWLGMLPATILYVYLGSAVHNISDLTEGRLPQTGMWGQFLFWGGLVATVVLVVMAGRIARNALQRELENGNPVEESAA